MRVAMLGPLRVEGDDGTQVEVGGARLRVLLGMLALYVGSAVPDGALVDALWGAAPPVDVRNALQTLIARLRKAVRPVGMDSRLVRSPGAGYLLSLLSDDVDVHRFEALAKRGRRELAAGRFGEASALLGEALALWRGPALLDMADTPLGRTWVTRLTELQVDAMEDHFDAELHLGHHAEILPDLEAACVQHPLRERLASLRMQALHAVGRQSEALAAYDEIRTTLAGELGIDPSAELRATHIAGLRGELARPVAPRAANSSLPVQLTTFIGREDELQLVAKLLSEARLVTLVGPGGSGKSRLAVEAASRHAAHSRRRVWFVSLAVVQDPGDVRDVVLAALGLSDVRLPAKPPALTQPVDEFARFADTLGTEQSVLVLDNCEHVLTAAAGLAYEMLVRVPQLRILATSREPLAITGEMLCPVDPLEVPAEQASVGDAAASSAVRLFVDRARMARPNFALTESTVDYVVEICRRLDGMPLALELAAARLRAMSARQIAQRLDDRFKLLTSASATVLPPRHRTLHAVVEWSWDLLSETERILACRLSVFPAGAMASAVEEVCSDDLLEPESVVYVLSSLVDKSIVTAVSDDDGEPRYRMLETIRAFAAQRLAEAGETAVVTERFARHFLRLAEETEPLLRTGEQLRALDVFNAEIDNMVAALRWSLDNAMAELAYRLTLSLLWYWMPRGLHAQAVSFASEVRRFGNAIPDYALATLSAIQGPTADLDALPENQGLRVLIDDCERTDALSRVPVLALAVPIIAFISRDQELIDRELGRALAHADPWVQASALWMQAFVLEDRGDLPGALRAREEALGRYQALGDRWGIAICLGSLAETCSLSGDHAGAIAAFERGHTLAIELGATNDANNQKLRLATEHMRSGDADRAQQCILELDQTAKATGSAWWEGMSILGAVDIARRRGDFAHAHAELARLAPVAASTLFFTDVMVREWIALIRAALAVSEGDHSQVRTVLVDVVRGAVARRDLSNTARAAEVLTLLLMREGNPRSAATVLGLVCAIRGVFDRGNQELRELVDDITAEIGHRAYAEAYRLSAELPKEDAIAALCETLAIPVEHAAVPPTRVWWGELWASRRMP